MNIIHLLYMENDLNNINKMYEKLTYFDQYGGSVVLFIIITIIIVLLISYFHTMINIQPIIDDWPNQRCKPTIIPFAGLITHPEGISASEYTAQNFSYCSQNILSGITGTAVQPLTYITNSLKSISNIIQQEIQNIRAMFDKIRTSMQTVTEEIMGRLMNVMIPLQQIIISFKDLIGKIQGTMTAGLFTLLGSYYTLKALMGAIAQFIITILIALAAMIVIFWIFPFTWGVAATSTAIFVALAIPLAIMLAFMVDTLHVNTSFSIPTVPKMKCFDKNTILNMKNGTQTKIMHVEVGDILSNGSIITAKFKVTTEGSTMYLLNNILVSDSHIVKYNNNWIPVYTHPKAKKFENYNEEYLYCLNTTNKIIEINDTIFTDWDEIYGESLNKVVNNDIIPIVNDNFIHKYLDYGFSEMTKIRMLNGTYNHINKIKINDILENGEKIYGIVEINGSDIVEQFKYNLGENVYIEGYATELNFKNTKLPYKHKKLYNLLTDRGTYSLYKNIFVKDYNSAIDRFL